MLLKVDPQTLLKISFTIVTQNYSKLVPETLLKIDPQKLLKISLKSVTKLKKITCKDCMIKTLNKTKRNYARKTLVNLNRILLSI